MRQVDLEGAFESPAGSSGDEHAGEPRGSFARVGSGRSRACLRVIILTSITTTLGLLSPLVEPFLQARFFILMGISVSFGLAFTIVLSLIGISCLYFILADMGGGGKACWTGLARSISGMLRPAGEPFAYQAHGAKED